MDREEQQRGNLEIRPKTCLSGVIGGTLTHGKRWSGFSKAWAGFSAIYCSMARLQRSTHEGRQLERG